MTCDIDPKEEHLQKWLKEGVSLETHTVDHPCPLLKDGDLAKAKSTYDRCVDKLAAVPNSRPVAFRMPCCDSLNTVSPRFYAEIFNKTTAKGNFLTIDSSVFNLITANDPDLPRELRLESDGSERFRKYLPADRTFVNYIEDYPYPYVIGGTCWEFPCVVPSDWSAQHYHNQNASPLTLRDWKAALDATVIKKGVYCLVFHPHGWSAPEQFIDLIDYAVAKHGKKVKFLTFREAQERLNQNVLSGHPLREPKTGAPNGVTIVGSAGNVDFRLPLDQLKLLRGVTGGNVDILVRTETLGFYTTWGFRNGEWGWGSIPVPAGRDLPGPPPPPVAGYKVYWYPKIDRKTVGIAANGTDHAIFSSSDDGKSYVKTDLTLPPGARLTDGDGDHGLRFIDIDEDGNDDIVFSNEKEYGIYLYTDLAHGWSKKVMAGKAGDPGRCRPLRSTARTTASSSIRDPSGGRTSTPISSRTTSIAGHSTTC